jgi:hypothetical protein
VCRGLFVCVYIVACMHARTHTYLYVHACMHARTHTYIYVHACMHACTYVCTYVYMHPCIHTQTDLYTHTQTDLYTHKQTQKHCRCAKEEHRVQHVYTNTRTQHAYTAHVHNTCTQKVYTTHTETLALRKEEQRVHTNGISLWKVDLRAPPILRSIWRGALRNKFECKARGVCRRKYLGTSRMCMCVCVYVYM